MKKTELHDYSQEIETLQKDIAELEKEVENIDRVIAERISKNKQEKEELKARKDTMSKLDYLCEKTGTIDTEIFDIKFKKLKLDSALSSKKQTLKYTLQLQSLYELEQQPSQE